MVAGLASLLFFVLVISTTLGLNCKTCFHISHTMSGVPADEKPNLKAILTQFEKPNCLSVRMSAEQTKSCEPSGKAGVISKCMTTLVRVKAKGMGNISEDATLQLTLHGRECALFPSDLTDGCFRLNDFDQKTRDTATLHLRMLVENWDQAGFDGEICYHDNVAAFNDPSKLQSAQPGTASSSIAA